jgi:hypothetical protein
MESAILVDAAVGLAPPPTEEILNLAEADYQTKYPWVAMLEFEQSSTESIAYDFAVWLKRQSV